MDTAFNRGSIELPIDVAQRQPHRGD